MYADVDVIVYGALEESVIFTDEAIMREFVDAVEDGAKDHGYPTKVYILYHDHPEGVDCECRQYESSGKPAYAFNIVDE